MIIMSVSNAMKREDKMHMMHLRKLQLRIAYNYYTLIQAGHLKRCIKNTLLLAVTCTPSVVWKIKSRVATL
jgi:hypothetical protein